MTALKGVVLGTLAAVVAFWVLYRLMRGRPVVARGEVLLRAIAIASMVAVAFAPRPHSAAQPGPAGGTASHGFPDDLTDASLSNLARLRGSSRPELIWRSLDAAGVPGIAPATREARLSEAARHARDLSGSRSAPFAGLLSETVDRMRAAQPDTPAQLLSLLDAAERTPYYDARLAAFVWRRAGEVQISTSARVALWARVGRHLRIAEALARAEQQVGPVTFVPWRKMSAAPRGYTGARVPPGLAAATRQVYEPMQAAAWERDGAIELRVEGAGGRLHRRGAASAVTSGERIRLGRLDVLSAGTAPLVLRHDRFGTFTVPARASVHARSLATLLDPARRDDVRALARAAMRGDARAMSDLEGALPATHGVIREELAARPASRGAARLRTLLTLFDE